MPRDLALSSNTPTAALQLLQAQPLANATHWAALLVVRSGAFSAALPLVAERAAWSMFAESLRDGASVARLESEDGESWIEALCVGDASAMVRGALREAVPEVRGASDVDADPMQQLQFRFATTPSALVALGNELAELLSR